MRKIRSMGPKREARRDGGPGCEVGLRPETAPHQSFLDQNASHGWINRALLKLEREADGLSWPLAPRPRGTVGNGWARPGAIILRMSRLALIGPRFADWLMKPLLLKPYLVRQGRPACVYPQRAAHWSGPSPWAPSSWRRPAPSERRVAPEPTRRRFSRFRLARGSCRRPMPSRRTVPWKGLTAKTAIYDGLGNASIDNLFAGLRGEGGRTLARRCGVWPP